MLAISGCGLVMMLSYAGPAVTKAYDKMNALWSTFLVRMVVWHFIALLSAGLHSVFAGLRKRREVG